MAYAPTGVFIYLVDELLNGAFAIAHHGGGGALGGGNQLAIHHQQAEVEALDELLHNYSPRISLRGLEAGGSILPTHDADGSPLAVVAVERLGHDGEAELVDGIA